MREKKELVAFYPDTMTTDVHKERNQDMVTNDDFCSFSTAKLAQDYKLNLYIDGFNVLKLKNFSFIPSIIDSQMVVLEQV